MKTHWDTFKVMPELKKLNYLELKKNGKGDFVKNKTVRFCLSEREVKQIYFHNKHYHVSCHSW